MSSDQTVYITAAARTAIGSFLGSLSAVAAPVLASTTIKQLLQQTHMQPEYIDEAILGCVLPAGVGQAPARQAVRQAGLPDSVGALTINKVCGSGLKAVMLGASNILLGESSVVLAGGMESMSQAPFYHTTLRQGAKMGHQTLIDGMIHDGLWDPYNNFHMGNAGELCAQKYAFSRQAQDDFATASYERSQAAVKTGVFKSEIAPVTIAGKKGDVIIDSDEQPFKDDVSKLPSLRPAFQKDGGTITAGNASSINDGAAALLLASEAAVKQHGLKPMAKILGWATHSHDPAWFTTAPVGAIQKVLDKTGLTASQIDLYEINEAFAVVPMAAMHELGLPHEKVNVRGGAIALGHPIGASGARILTTLAYALRDLDKRYGLATLCIGGGEAVALVIERLS